MEKEEPKPRPVEPAPEVEARADVVVPASPVRCPFCHEGVNAAKPDWVVCSACLARHHDGCWGESTRCASCGHSVALGQGDARIVPTPEQAARNKRQLKLSLGSVGVVLGVFLGALAADGLRTKAPVVPQFVSPAQVPAPRVEPELSLETIDARFEAARVPLLPFVKSPGHVEGPFELTMFDPRRTSRILAQMSLVFPEDRAAWADVVVPPRRTVELGDYLVRPDVVVDRSAPLVGRFRFTFAGDPRGNDERSKLLAAKVSRALGRFPDVLRWTLANDSRTTALIRLGAASGVSLDSITKEFDGKDGFTFVGTEIVGGVAESIFPALGTTDHGARRTELSEPLQALGAYLEARGDGLPNVLVVGVPRDKPVDVSALDAALAPARLARDAPFSGLILVRVPRAHSERSTELDACAQRAGGEILPPLHYDNPDGATLTVFFPKSAPTTLGKLEAAFASQPGTTFALSGDAGDPP